MKFDCSCHVGMFSWQGGIAADERFDMATDELLENVELPVGAGARCEV